jgi:hypothetical protein
MALSGKIEFQLLGQQKPKTYAPRKKNIRQMPIVHPADADS